jgi:hypothetical protein
VQQGVPAFGLPQSGGFENPEFTEVRAGLALICNLQFEICNHLPISVTSGSFILPKMNHEGGSLSSL